MSGVYARNRNTTFFAPVDNAAELQDAVTAYVFNEKRIPKRYRLILGTDLIRKTDEIMDYAIAANRTWLDEKHIDIRTEWWNRCLNACDQLDRKLRRTQKAIESATPDSMAKILELLDKEIGVVNGQKKADKSPKEKKP